MSYTRPIQVGDDGTLRDGQEEMEAINNILTMAKSMGDSVTGDSVYGASEKKIRHAGPSDYLGDSGRITVVCVSFLSLFY